jgi:folate-binding protein YgfZ
MTQLSYTLLEDRGFIAVTGADTRAFLQGLISNDVDKVTPDQAAHAAFLTPQGKYLHDFFVIDTVNGLLLEGEAARLDDLLRRLRMYKLRADVDLKDVSGDWVAMALFGSGVAAALDLNDAPGCATSIANGVVYMDPRLSAVGGRAALKRNGAGTTLEDLGFAAAEGDEYDTLRISLGLPNGSADLTVDKAVLLENGFEELNGVDFDKGCFLGQEVTARTKYRGLVKKRLMPVAIDGEAPPAGTPVLLGDEEAGEMRSSRPGVGLALMRLAAVEKAAEGDDVFTAGDARLTPRKPDWAAF